MQARLCAALRRLKTPYAEIRLERRESTRLVYRGDQLVTVDSSIDYGGFARTLAEAKQMRDVLKQSKVVFQLGHQARQATCALQARELISQGVLGPIIPSRNPRRDEQAIGAFPSGRRMVRPDVERTSS